MFSCVTPGIIICIVIVSCFSLGGVYGIDIAAVGMLLTLRVTLATDAYGLVVDNAGGIVEMTPDYPEVVRECTDAFGALGSTTPATSKGFAIGSAVLTTLALMSAYAKNTGLLGGYLDMDLTNSLVLPGVLFGAILPFLFAALTMLSVRKAAGSIIVEVQRQFRTIDGLLEGKKGVECDSTACISL